MSANNKADRSPRKQPTKSTKGKTQRPKPSYRQRVLDELSSGSLEFDHFRLAIEQNPGLRREFEDALLLNLLTVNPSERGARFVTGGTAEWIVACCAYSAGVPLIPAGHSANGYDLRDVMNSAKSLWSVKSQSTSNPQTFRISNGLGGGGQGFTAPTIFLSPNLPGMVYVHPELHAHVTLAQKFKPDAVTLAHGVVKRHAKAHPECVIEAEIPANPGTATGDPFLELAKDIIDPQRFPQLARIFTEVTPPSGDVVEQVRGLLKLLQDGSITEDHYNHLILQVRSSA